MQMMKLLRMSLLVIAAIIAAGLLAVPVSAAQQGYFCPNTNLQLTPRVVLGTANRVKVTDTQALTWLCEGRSPQEILLASRVGRAAGLSIDQLFALRNQGQSWDAILTTYDVRNQMNWSGIRFYYRPSNNPFKNFEDVRENRNGRVVRIGNGRFVFDQNGRFFFDQNGRIVRFRNGRIVQNMNNGGNLRFVNGQWWMYNAQTGLWQRVR
jgi:hypothetical protein